MQPPRYDTSTILNKPTLDPCVGGVFYGLHNAIHSVQALIENQTCREVVVKDTVSGDIVYHSKLPDDAPFYQFPYGFENS